MRNYYVFYVMGEKAREYLKGTNYVGLWANDQFEALDTMAKYFSKDTPFVMKESVPSGETVGYLY